MENQMPLPGNETVNPMQLASIVSAKVDICDVYLEESTIKRSGNYARTERVNFATNVDTQLHEESKIITVIAKLSVFPIIDKDNENEDTFRIDASYVVKYQLADVDGIKKEHLDAFGKLNGLFNVWPFWREYVQSTTTRMGYPALTLPVFRILPQKAKAGPEDHYLPSAR